MTPFEYRRAETVADAVDWLRATPGAKLVAGGQSLLAAMKLDLAAPDLLIDLSRLSGLRSVREEGGALWIGAMCSHAMVAKSMTVLASSPGLARLAAGIADQQVRNRGTFGGSVANADPAACWPAGVLACGATLVTDRRDIAADDFFQGLFATALASDEVLLGARFDRLKDVVYVKEEQPASRFAVTGVAVARDAARGLVRVAITGLGLGVCRWPQAEAALARDFEPQALQGLLPEASLAIGDLHASAHYRLHLAGVLARRAVQRMTSQR